MTPEELRVALAAPFVESDVDWRLQGTNKDRTGGWAIPYLTNRAIQQRLDSTVGPDNWRNRYIPWHGPSTTRGGQLCALAIYFEGKKEWIEKMDGAEDSEIEPVKGGLSDAMKRAAVQWGIGRYLYDMEMQWVDVEEKGKNLTVKASSRPKLDAYHKKFVSEMQASPIKPTGNVLSPAQKVPPEKSAIAPPTVGDVPAAGNTGTESQTAVPRLYKVVGLVCQPSMSGGQDTHLKIENDRGQCVDAFLAGVNAELAVGTILTKVGFNRQEKQGVTYYDLEHYELMPPEQMAA